MQASLAPGSVVHLPPLLVERVRPDVVALRLNRPDVHNTLDEHLIFELSQVVESLAEDDSCRLLVLSGQGTTFCAGSDILWMERGATAGQETHLAEARALARLMKVLYDFPKPLVALVQGSVVGVGLGLLACCDIVVASDSALFRLSDAKVGLVPAVISPYLVRAVGARAMQRYFLTAEPFSATEAKSLGFVHEIVPDRMLEAAEQKLIERLVLCGPTAQQEAKALLRRLEVMSRPDDDAITTYTAHLIARLRTGEEGREGFAAYAGKRDPLWIRK